MSEFGDKIDLEALDPGAREPGFWIRFHGRVMDAAGDELARRRMVGDLSVAGVVFHWRKRLVPLTLLAATVAGIFVMRHEEPVSAVAPVALEEVLTEDLTGDPIPTFLSRETELEEVAFLTAAGGF
jgi:hypothetical protein